MWIKFEQYVFQVLVPIQPPLWIILGKFIGFRYIKNLSIRNILSIKVNMDVVRALILYSVHFKDKQFLVEFKILPLKAEWNERK